MDNLEQRVRNTVAKYSGIAEDQVKNESRFAGDLGMDPLDLVELLALLKKEFGVSIEDSSAKTFITVQEVIDTLRKKIGDQ